MTNHDQLASGAFARKANQAYAAEKRRIEAGGSPFQCLDCFDTQTIDQGGREIPCPYCIDPTVTVKLTGLAHGLGDHGRYYDTCSDYSSTTMTFTGTRVAILTDVVRETREAKREAVHHGLSGRNSVSSGAIAIEARVRKALA